MSGFAGGQLCLVAAEVLANISGRYEREGQNRRSGCCQGEVKERQRGQEDGEELAGSEEDTKRIKRQRRDGGFR